MTKSEVARLLSMIAAFDRRTIGESDVEAWHLILGDLEVADCAAAVREHYTAKRDWIMPADVRMFAEAESRRREGRIRRAELDARLRRENGGELQARPVAALTAGQPIPADDPVRAERRQMLAKAAHTKQERVETETREAAEHQARREQARREIAERHGATTGDA